MCQKEVSGTCRCNCGGGIEGGRRAESLFPFGLVDRGKRNESERESERKLRDGEGEGEACSRLLQAIRQGSGGRVCGPCPVERKPCPRAEWQWLLAKLKSASAILSAAEPLPFPRLQCPGSGAIVCGLAGDILEPLLLRRHDAIGSQILDLR